MTTDTDPFPDVGGSGNFDRALEAAMSPMGGLEDGDDGDFLTGGPDLTLAHIRTLSTTSHHSQRSAVSVASSGPSGDTEREISLSLPEPAGVGASPAALDVSRSSETLDGKVDSPTRRKVPGLPSVSPRPRGAVPRTPGGNKAGTPSSPLKEKKKSPLPRVAMLASQTATTPKRAQRESPPSFRAGGNASSRTTPTRARAGAGAAGRSPPSSSVMARDMSTKSSMRSTAGTTTTAGTTATAGTVATETTATTTTTAATGRATTPGKATSSTSSQRPQWGVNPGARTRQTPSATNTGAATRTARTTTTATATTPSGRSIVKPPENIKRALQESHALSKMDSLDSKEDSEMKNLKEILDDIKTIKSELGVESTVIQEDGGDDDEKQVEDGVEVESKQQVDGSGEGVGAESPTKSPTKSEEDSIEILGGLDSLQGENAEATFLNDSKKVTDELDEVSGPAFAEVEKEAAKEEIEAHVAERKEAGATASKMDETKTACMPCCSVM